jgi:hypothetical protein
MITKDLGGYRSFFLRQEKALRDHGTGNRLIALREVIGRASVADGGEWWSRPSAEVWLSVGRHIPSAAYARTAVIACH